MDQPSFEPNNQAFVNNEHSNNCDQNEIKKNGSQTRRAWSLKEDNQLKQAIKMHSTNWLLVAQALQNRNPSQCAQRWKRIKPYNYNVRKPWTNKEDQLLLRLVQSHKKNWVQIAKCIPNRSSKQVRERFVNKLNPEINQKPFTIEEDMIIVEGYKSFGSKWCKISKLLQGRPENIIKNRYYSYIRKRYFNIENPYYVVPQQSNEIQKTIQNEQTNNTEKRSAKTTRGKLKFRKRFASNDDQDKKGINYEFKNNKKYLDQEQIWLQMAKSEENYNKKKKVNINNLQEQCKLREQKDQQIVKEEFSNNQSQVKQEAEQDKGEKLEQIQESLSISPNYFGLFPLIYNTVQPYEMMYMFPQQLPMQFIPQYCMNSPFVQFGVQSQETMLSRTQDQQQG